MDPTFRNNLTTSSASVKQSTNHSSSHTASHPQHQRCEHLKCRFITLVWWWDGVKESCVIAYRHRDNARQEESKRQWNEPSPSQAHEVWEPDFLPQSLQLLQFPSAVRAIRAHHVVRVAAETLPPFRRKWQTVLVPEVGAWSLSHTQNKAGKLEAHV